MVYSVCKRMKANRICKNIKELKCCKSTVCQKRTRIPVFVMVHKGLLNEHSKYVVFYSRNVPKSLSALLGKA